ncbi:PP2C family protein-serine/threonine phosphatase [Streptomyces omiyaensis]|uniref:PP2C family protein-serine/threonine phosphatase n=1 Tax=Streptomyces omiyaensis TaxID=68247 RepID=UPI0036F9D957
MSIRTGHASREGTREDNADAAAVHQLSTGAIGAAVIDGIGHGPRTSGTAPLLAAVTARTAAHRGPLAGLLTAGLLISDPGPDDDEANAVGVAAALEPLDALFRIAWVGDCRAYGWSHETGLRNYTTDHTVGEQLRSNGAPWDLAADHDNWVRTSLGDATVATVYEVVIPDGLVILTSDGVHDYIDHGHLEDLVREHAIDPPALAEALVAAGEWGTGGYRDDATAVVLRRG